MIIPFLKNKYPKRKEVNNNMSKEVLESTDTVQRKGMTLKSVPVSLKKIRKVVDDLNEREEPLTPAEKFDLEISAAYLRHLKDTVSGLLEDVE